MKVVLREEDEKAKGIPKMSHHRVRVMIMAMMMVLPLQK